MPGYGVPSDPEGLLPWEWAVERLDRSRTFWLVTLWPDGRPHAMPVWAVWHDEALWWSTGGRSRKAGNLRADPRCVVTTCDGEEPVVLEGEAEIVTGADQLATFLTALNAKYGTDYGPELVDPAENVTARLRPTVAFGQTQSDFAGSQTRWTFA